MTEQIVRVNMDARQAMKDLSGIKYEQFPYAYAKALTETAFRAQRAVQTMTRRKFDLHTEYIPRGILVEHAHKRELIQFSSTSSAVFTSKGITGFMSWHEEGGTKRPRGAMLTIPGPHFKKAQYKTTTGRVRKKWQPKTMLSKPGFGRLRGQAKKGKLSKKPFIIPSEGTSPPLIVRRVKPGKRGLEVIYTMQKLATIKPRWNFEATVRRTANRFFEKIFEKEFQRALTTAK